MIRRMARENPRWATSASSANSRDSLSMGAGAALPEEPVLRPENARRKAWTPLLTSGGDVGVRCGSIDVSVVGHQKNEAVRKIVVSLRAAAAVVETGICCGARRWIDLESNLVDHCIRVGLHLLQRCTRE